jgi:hypothetical protein
MINAVANNRDVLITLSDSSALPGFLGYRLERKTETGAWLVWDGVSFSGVYLPISTIRFTDYDVPYGLYQYRYSVDLGLFTDYLFSDWVNINAGRIGWSFENYTPPEGLFGEVLTADDLRYTYLWGIDFRASNGDIFTDAQVRMKINSAIDEISRALKITIKKTRVHCQPGPELIQGTDYDEADDPYTYRHDKWRRSGRVALRKRPIISISRFDLYSISDQKILDLLTWISADHRKGIINFFPKAGADGQFRIAPASMSMGVTLMGGDYPHGYKIDYVAGFEDAGHIPADLRDVIGKAAACKLLNIIGDGLIAGFSSSSLSMDGVSESFSSTQSATNAYFGARIQVYLKDIETYLKENRSKFGSFVIGSI